MNDEQNQQQDYLPETDTPDTFSSNDVITLLTRKISRRALLMITGALGLTALVGTVGKNVLFNSLHNEESEETNIDEPITDAWQHIPVQKRQGGLIGVTFRAQQAEWFGMQDTDAAFDEILALPIDVVRIGAYWNMIEKPDGSFDFSQIDHLLAKIKGHGKKTIITIGMKAPGYPEFYIPQQYQQELPDKRGKITANHQPTLVNGVIRFVQACSEHIATNADIDSIYALQIENEPEDQSGDHDWTIDARVVQNEIATVRNSFPNIRLLANGFARNGIDDLINHDILKRADGLDDILQLPVSGVGYDYYAKIPQSEITPRKTKYMNTRKAPWGMARLQEFMKQIQGKRPVGAMEIQAEPWEIQARAQFPKGTAPHSCKPEDIILNYNECAELGKNDFFLFWGIEYMLARKRQGDSAYWDAFQKVLQKS